MARTVKTLTLPATGKGIKAFEDASAREVQAMAICSQNDADSDPIGDPADAAWGLTGSASIVAALKAIAISLTSGVTLTDSSVSSATGASQTVAAADVNRKSLLIFNPSGASWWINPTGGTAAPDSAGSFELLPGKEWNPKPAPRNIVKAIGPETAQLTVVLG